MSRCMAEAKMQQQGRFCLEEIFCICKNKTKLAKTNSSARILKCPSAKEKRSATELRLVAC